MRSSPTVRRSVRGTKLIHFLDRNPPIAVLAFAAGTIVAIGATIYAALRNLLSREEGATGR